MNDVGKKRAAHLKNEIFNKIKEYYTLIHKPKSFSKGESKIPYAGRVYNEDEIINAVDAALDFWLTAGKYADTFECELAKFLGINYCSLTNSGSSANLLAFMALTSQKLGNKRIKRGDEIITAAAAFPTTLAPIVQYGAVPVFIDITLPAYNIDCSNLEKAISKKTKAVLLAHTMGNPFDLEAVNDFCNKYNLWLIEDNCDALGSRYLIKGEWKYTGTIGNLGTSSFYPPHHITMGEGGAVYTNDDLLKTIIDSFRDWGRDCWCKSGHDNTCGKRFMHKFAELPQHYDHKYVYSHLGYNLRITDLQAAIGCAQLRKLPDFIKARKDNWKLLKEGLAPLSDIFILPEAAYNSDPSWFGFIITIRENAGFTRKEIINHLELCGIQTRMLFSGNIIRQPAFDDIRNNPGSYRIVEELTNTDTIMKNTFWIGVYPGLTKEMMDYIIESFLTFVKTYKG